MIEAQHSSVFRTLLVYILCVLPIVAFSAREPVDDEMDEVTAEELQQEEVPVDEKIFIERWNPSPFGNTFLYTDDQIKEKWDYLMRGIRMPYPSAERLEKYFNRYPWLSEDIENWDGSDYAALEKRYVGLWRKFFAGEFQSCRNDSLTSGPLGMIPGLFCQLMYSIYLSDRHSVKLMMLQDIANRAESYFDAMDDSKLDEDPDEDVRAVAVLVRLGYIYSIARIAEEAPIPIAIARNYIGKIKDSSEYIFELAPSHPIAHAFRAGVDAGIMRRVGKLTGRITYRAKTTTVEDSFKFALEEVPDMPILAYEYANAKIYVKKKRGIEDALELLESATKMQPQFSMDALDTMYAYKRLQEVKLYKAEYRSFRKFEKARRKFAKKTDRNLTNVSTPPLTKEMLDNAKKYELPKR